MALHDQCSQSTLPPSLRISVWVWSTLYRTKGAMCASFRQPSAKDAWFEFRASFLMVWGRSPSVARR
ncbi:hypothetical protein E2C01_069522 [Portunus trituberculatus]|uniref:Uncharacterized protein n=1 Tax=Portunus trituberculatus TaxID=210409 RepID=A0A5B7I105_PORTR|nr:hypothetical protein [Portunus trituberculatus]